MFTFYKVHKGRLKSSIIYLMIIKTPKSQPTSLFPGCIWLENVCVCLCVCVSVCVCMCVYILFVHVCVHVCMCVHTLIAMYACLNNYERTWGWLCLLHIYVFQS